METARRLLALIIALMIELIIYTAANAQGVGIGTANPRARLHVAGNLRIDSVRAVAVPKRIAVLDTAGVVAYCDIDTLGKRIGQPSAAGTLFFSRDSIQSMFSNAPQTCLAFQLPAGSYLILAQCEVYNSGYLYGSRVALSDSSGAEISYSVPYSSPGDFSPWSGGGRVTVSSATWFRVQFWGIYYTTTYIRRVRVSATRL